MGNIRTNPCFQAMADVCDEHGVAFDVVDGGKHPKLIVFACEPPLSVPFPKSPSDIRSPLNSAAQLRRLIEAATTPEASMNHEVVTVLGKTVATVEYKGERVVTLKQIDTVHEKAEGQARKQFNAHRTRFVEAVDFHEIKEPSEIRTLGFSRPQGGTPDKVLLFTERGYGKIVKGWNDDLAWALHDAMQDAYFVVRDVAKAVADGEVTLPESVWRRIGGVVKSVTHKSTEDMRAGVELVLEEVVRLGHEIERMKSAPIVPSFDMAGTVTSRDIMDMAGISRDGRVRGTTGGIITRAMKDFCLSHGFAAQRAPEAIDPDRRWRFPRQAALDWLTGSTMGGEVIRNHIAKVSARRARTGQRSFTLVPSAQVGRSI
ncbi:ORF6N domain-containing protein [Roseixanthobacter pseudopolyaromaticivorans]|uniref:ORF6N domain-containing protein n=1 Tax=Xanthobacteraceae TaxID=335928 RepID=UPI00372C546C